MHSLWMARFSLQIHSALVTSVSNRHRTPYWLLLGAFAAMIVRFLGSHYKARKGKS